MKKGIQTLFIFLLVIISYNFFDARFLPEKTVQYTVFFTTALAILLSIPHFFQFKKGFVLPVQMIVFSIALSIIMAKITWEQGYRDSIIETAPFMLWILFFFLLAIKIQIRTIEKIILIYGVTYAILYFFQLANYDKVLFGKPLSGEEFKEYRGAIRIIFPGAGIFILSIFMAINKLTTTIKRKWIWIFLTTIGIIIPVLQVTRQFIIGVLMIYIYHIVKGKPFYIKFLVLIMITIGLSFILISDIPQIKGVIEAQERDSKLGKDYIRVQAGSYFLTEFSPTSANQIFGNGAPNWGFSNYGIFVQNLAEEKGYHISDVGIIGMYAMFGLLSVLGYILIWIKSIQINLPKEYYYLKYYLWYLLLTSLTWYSVYHYSYLISTVFTLYIYQVLYNNQKSVSITKSTHNTNSTRLQFV